MSQATRNALAIVLAVLMALGPFLSLAPNAGARVTKEFSNGQKEMEFDFPAGTESYKVNLTIPRSAQLFSAQVGVSGEPLGSVLTYPKGPALDLGLDGTVDWEFWGPGYGALGRQQVLSDNSTSGKVVLNGPGSDQSLILRLPAQANIETAVMRVTGGPNSAAGWWNQSWLYRIPVNITNNRAVALGEVLVDIWVDTSGLNVKDTKEFRVIYKPPTGTQEERPSQVVDEHAVSGIIQDARVVFRTKAIDPLGNQQYYIYLSIPSPPTPAMATDFKPNDIRNRPEATTSEVPSGTAPSYFLKPGAIAVSGTDLYVADTDHHVVRIFDAFGALKGTIGTYGSPGMDNKHLNGPDGVAVGPDGRIWVSDTQNNRVQVFLSDLSFNMSITDGTYIFGNSNTNLTGPHGLRVLANGTMVLADTGNHIVQRFKADGAPIDFIGNPGWAGNDNDHFDTPYDVCVREDDAIMVADWNNHRVQLFDKHLAYSGTLGAMGTANGQFMFPSGVECTGGYTYVADTANHRVQVFAGITYKRQYGITGGPGLGVDQLNQPTAVIVDSRSVVHIADMGNNRIVRATNLTVKVAASDGEYPNTPNLDIGADGLVEWSYKGTLAGPTSTGEIKVRLNVATYAATPKTDKWGNRYVDLPLKVSAASQGTITVDQIDIQYDLVVPVNATGAIAQLLASTGESVPSVTLPIKVTALSGKLKLSNVSVVYDMPPTLIGDIPSTYSVSEDGSKAHLIDLYGYFKDDTDPKDNLTFALVSATNGTIVNVGIVDGHFLSLDSFNGTANDHWHGTSQVVVSCTNTRGLTMLSNKFSVIVRHVNHAPQFTSIPVLIATEDQNYTYQVKAIDVDGDKINYTLAYGPKGMTLDPATGTIRWRPEGYQVGSQDVEVLADDGDPLVGKSRQAFNLTVKNVNDQPVVKSTAVTDAKVGEEYMYALIAEDEDNDALNYSLVKAPKGMTIDKSTGTIRWTPQEGQQGTAKVSVGISDGTVTVTQDYQIKVQPSGKVAGIPIMYLAVGLGLLLLIMIIVVVAVLVARRRKAHPPVKPRSAPKRTGRTIEETVEEGQAEEVEEAPIAEPEECPKCGDLIEDDLGYCSSCGYVVKKKHEEPLYRPGKEPEAPPKTITKVDPGPQRFDELPKFEQKDGSIEIVSHGTIVVEKEHEVPKAEAKPDWTPPKVEDETNEEPPKAEVKEEVQAEKPKEGPKKDDRSLDDILKALKD